MSANKKVEIIGVPMDLGSKPLGVEMGPMAIRYAGLHSALNRNKFKFVDNGNIEIENQKVNHSSVTEIARVSEKLSHLVFNALSQDSVPVILGGDHSVSIGSIAGAAKSADTLGLLWIDCHPDANTPESSPSGNVHGMTVAISLGHGFDKLRLCGGFQPKVRPEHVCIIGAKDIDQAEREFLNKLGVKMYTIFDIEQRGIFKIMDEAIDIISTGTDKIHVSFDVDALDPLIAPGTGILSRGGLSYREITYIMETLGKNNLVNSIDIIEINPLLDIKNQTSELAVELLLSALGGSYSDYERNYLNSIAVNTTNSPI